MTGKRQKRRAVQRTKDFMDTAKALHQIRNQIDLALEAMTADEPYHIDLADNLTKEVDRLQKAAAKLRKHSIEQTLRNKFGNLIKRKATTADERREFARKYLRERAPGEKTPRIPGWKLTSYKASPEYIRDYTKEWRDEG